MRRGLACGFVFALGWFGSSCGLHPCQDAAGSDASYTVDVVAPYVEGGAYTFVPNGGSYSATTQSCSSTDGVVAGASLQFKGTGTMSDQAKTCDMVTAQALSLPAAIAANGPSTNADALRQIRGSSAFMYALEDATVGACSGTIVFGFFSGGGPGGILGTPMPGKFPPTILCRLFLPLTDGCQPCDDNFVVQLKKV